MNPFDDYRTLETAAMVMVANLLLSLDEVLNK